jgi:hypothetical protein
MIARRDEQHASLLLSIQHGVGAIVDFETIG